MAVLFLKLLGGFGARLSSGKAAVIPIRKGQALFAYLALNPGKTIARSRLSALLWGDHADERARSNLRETLNVLRKALGPAQDRILLADRQSVGLDGAALDVDALAFQDLVARGAPADLEAAVSLYRGDLLDDLDLSDPGFQAWLEDERRRYRRLMAGALDALMAHKGAEGARQDAVVLAERLLRMEPLREDIHRALMGLYADLGQRQAALQQYQRCRDLLASELNVGPEPETEALYRTLLNGDRAGAVAAGRRGGVIVDRRVPRAGGTVTRRADHGHSSAGMAGVVRESGRRATAAGRALVIGGVAALSWLLAWGYQAVQPLPDIQESLKIEALSSGKLAGIADGLSESSGPDLPDRRAPTLGAGSGLAAAAFGGLPGVSTAAGLAGLHRGASSPGAGHPLAVVSIGDEWRAPRGLSGSSGPALHFRVPPSRRWEPALASMGGLPGVLAHEARLAMQRAAEDQWSGLADSWDLAALRAFGARYAETDQAIEAERRIAFLIERQREAQAGLNRLGYDAGPVDGVWGPRSAQAMRAFQSASGKAAEEGDLETLLGRLKTASVPAPQPDHDAAGVASVSLSTQDGAPEGNRWTASGMSREGSRVFATATRHGDTLEIVFDLDHRGVNFFGPPHVDLYSQSCTVSLLDPIFECWISERRQHSFGAKVFGTFPRLTYEMQLALGWKSGPLPSDIVLEFDPELKTATPAVAAPAIPTPEPRLQPVRPEPELAGAPVPPSDPDVLSGHSRWAAYNEAGDGTRIMATATRQGETLELAFDVDHRDAATFGTTWPHRYTYRCTAAAAAPAVDCLIPATPFSLFGARVAGTFPRLTYEFMTRHGPSVRAPANVEIEFHVGLTPDDLKIAARTGSRRAGKGAIQPDSPPEAAAAAGLETSVEGGAGFDGVWAGQTLDGFWKVTLVVEGSHADLRIDHPDGILRGAGEIKDNGEIPLIVGRAPRWKLRSISGTVHQISVNAAGGDAGGATINLQKSEG